MQHLKSRINSFIQIVLLFSAVLFTVTHADEWQKDKLDQYFDQLAKDDRANLSISLLKDGEVIYQRAVGKLAPGGAEATNDTLYRMGSISKMYASTMIMQMVEAGQLKLNTPLSQFFPEVKNASAITIKDLLSHRSGIHNFTDMPAYPGYMTEAKTKEQMLEIIYKMSSDYEPGTAASYSNSNYVLLGYIVEAIDNTSYADALDKRINKPLKLTKTTYGGEIDISKNQANSMLFQQGKWQAMPETHMSIPHAAGALVSTSAEVAQFAHALFTGKLLSEDSVKAMMSIQDGFGLGVIRFPFYDRFAYGHTGGIDGFSSITGYFPESGLSFSLLSSGLNMNLNDITIAMLSAYFNRDFSIPVLEQNSVSLSAAQLEVFVGDYSTPALPIDIRVFVNDNTLFAQGSGQGAFPLEAVSQQKFVAPRFGIEIEFNDKRKDGKAMEFIMRQGGGNFPFSRK